MYCPFLILCYFISGNVHLLTQPSAEARARAGTRALSSIVDVAKLESATADEIAYIWRQYHLSKVCARTPSSARVNAHLLYTNTAAEEY
jgi:hypothetical protein